MLKIEAMLTLFNFLRCNILQTLDCVGHNFKIIKKFPYDANELSIAYRTQRRPIRFIKPDRSIQNRQVVIDSSLAPYRSKIVNIYKNTKNKAYADKAAL